MSQPPARPTFSVIVPTLEEEAELEGALRSARGALGPQTELIVVDGGSRDRTRSVAAGLARLIVAEPGRGCQLAAGAAVSTGRVLVFLHADTRLDPATGEAILAELEDPRVVGGCNRFGVRPAPGWPGRYRFLEVGVNARTRLFRTATGDQAIFATREAYERVGGIPDYPLFEDVAFVRALRKIGRFAPLGTVARTSRRRWESRGFWRTVSLHWLLRGAYWAGVAPRRLSGWYGSVSSRAR